MTEGRPVAEPVQSIVVPTDGSDVARRALDHALSIAERYDATVSVLAVVDPNGAALTFGVAEVDELERAKERLVDDIVSTYDDRTVDVTGTVRRGRPAGEILAYANEIGTDLLVVGRSNRDGVTETLRRSTTDRIVTDTSIPVLVVPEPDAE